MKTNLFSLISVAVFLFSCGHLVALPAKSEPATHFTRLDMDGLFYKMTSRGAKVALVMVPFKLSDGITVREKIDQLQTIPKTNRTEDEIQLLKSLHEGLRNKSFPETSIIDHRQKTYDLDLPAQLSDSNVLDQTLQQVVALDSRYEVVKSGALSVICPKNDPVKTETITLVLKEVPAEQAMAKLDAVLQSQGIRLLQVNMGPIRVGGGGFYGDLKITLNLVDVPILEVCSRFAEALGTNYTWTLLTTEKDRIFGFSNCIHLETVR